MIKCSIKNRKLYKQTNKKVHRNEVVLELLPVEVNDAGQMALTPPGHVSRLQLFPPLRSLARPQMFTTTSAGRGRRNRNRRYQWQRLMEAARICAQLVYSWAEKLR